MANGNVRKSGIPKKRHSQQNETTNAFHYFEALYGILPWNGGRIDDQKISGSDLEFLTERVFKLFKSAPVNAAASCFGEWMMCDGHPLQLAVASQYVEQKQCQLRLLRCAGTDSVNSLAGR